MQLPSLFVSRSEVGNELLSLGILGNLIFPESISSLALLVDLNFLVKLECFALSISANFGSNFVFHPLVSVGVLHGLIFLSELKLFERVNLVLDDVVCRCVNSAQSFVSLGSDECSVEDVGSLDFKNLPLVALLADSPTRSGNKVAYSLLSSSLIIRL